MKSENEIAESGINPESWRPLLELATREVFEIMLGSKLETSEATECIPLEFMAMVGLAGELRGVLSLRCTSKSAAMMASKMLDLEPEAVGEQMWDATGEIANMIAGNFKNKLTGMGDRCVHHQFWRRGRGDRLGFVQHQADRCSHGLLPADVSTSRP